MKPNPRPASQATSVPRRRAVADDALLIFDRVCWSAERLSERHRACTFRARSLTTFRAQRLLRLLAKWRSLRAVLDTRPMGSSVDNCRTIVGCRVLSVAGGPVTRSESFDTFTGHFRARATPTAAVSRWTAVDPQRYRKNRNIECRSAARIETMTRTCNLAVPRPYGATHMTNRIEI